MQDAHAAHLQKLDDIADKFAANPALASLADALAKPQTDAGTVRELVRTINTREKYTYFSTARERFRVVTARTRKNALGDREFQVQALGSGKWFTCCPSEISVEG